MEKLSMSIRQTFIAAAASLIAFATVSASVLPASAQTLRYANQGDLKSLDPYTLRETTTIAHHGQVYEGLVGRGKDLQIIPALAESWETPEPTRWRFHLRKGVKFHNGDPFTADDVVFSADRVRAKGSDFTTVIPADAKVLKIDDYTVDFVLTKPNPILTSQWDVWYIMDKKWAEANNANAPTPAAATSPSFASLNANGTGPFTIESHQPGVKTVFKVNPNWWGKPEHNLKEIIFTPIASDATRVAALLSGEVDIIEPVPVQDIARVNGSANAAVMAGPELRTIFLGMDQIRDELLFSNIKGKNPFKDIRVREAFYKAIDIELIKSRVMRGLSTPSALMIAPPLFKLSGDFTRPKYRRRRRQETAGRCRLSRRLRSRHGLPERSLCQRRRDLPGGGRHARAHRGQGDPERAAEGAVFCQGVQDRRLQHLILSARLDTGHAGFAQCDA
jgi:peptide/nickel transport system substrate-binding protein